MVFDFNRCGLVGLKPEEKIVWKVGCFRDVS